MAIAKDRPTKDAKAGNGFCDEAYTILTEMKQKIRDLQNRAPAKDDETSVQERFGRHLCELADEIEWKLQILAHSCPYEWSGSSDFDSSVQVDEKAASKDREFSPGYLGG